MEIKLTKGMVNRIIGTLESKYSDMDYCIEGIAAKGLSMSNDAVSLVRINAGIEATHNILLVLGINPVYENGKVKLFDNDGKEIAF